MMLLVVWCVTVLTLGAAAQPTVPHVINYQGRLVNGTNLVNGNIGLTFRIYKLSTGGSKFFEDSNTVQVVDGLYNARLGENVTFGSLSNALSVIDDLWLEVLVDGVPLSPREKIQSVVYALVAETVEDDAITAAKIAPGAVDQSHLAKGYQAGRVTLSIPSSGLVTNFPVGFAPAFTTAPVVTMTLHPSGDIPSDLSINRVRAINILANGYTADIEVAPYTDGTFLHTTDIAIFVLEGIDLDIIAGHPAIAMIIINQLSYAHALDASGATWAPYVSPAPGLPVDQIEPISLESISGNPAIAFKGGVGSNHLFYVRANDATGGAWGTVVLVDNNTDVGGGVSMKVVNGNPSVSYYDAVQQDLKYVRATDPIGATWGVTLRVDTNSNVGQETSLAVAAGNPAIAYKNTTFGAVKYVRALDASGNSWGTPVNVKLDDPIGISMAIVNGNPAISYVDTTLAQLKYVRANNATGTVWGADIVVAENVATNANTSLAVVGGRPAISYRTSTGAHVVQAANANGTSWGQGLRVSQFNEAGQPSSLADVGGMPAIAYQSGAVPLQPVTYVVVSNLAARLDWIAVEP